MKPGILILPLACITQALVAAPIDYLPPPPPFEKQLADYTAQDVVGCAFAWKAALPNGHPFKPESGAITIKAEWPGAKIPANTDVILSYIFHAATPVEETGIAKGIYWTIHEMMDVQSSQKATAFARLYDAQTDGVKRRKLAFMVKIVFPYLADERLLLPLKDMLDDSSVYRSERSEGGHVGTTSVRLAARKMLSNIIFDKELLSLDLPEGQSIMSGGDQAAIFGEDVSEADSCALLKAWITNHWTEISAQAAKLRAKPDRTYELPRKPLGLGYKQELDK